MAEKKMQITINGENFFVKPGMKAIMIFEKITDKAFEIKTTTDILVYIYSSILSGTPDARMTLDEMMEAFDNEPGLFKEATDLVLARNAVEKVVELSNEGGPEPKKE